MDHSQRQYLPILTLKFSQVHAAGISYILSGAETLQLCELDMQNNLEKTDPSEIESTYFIRKQQTLFF